MDENKDTAGNKTDEELECEKKLINLFRHPSLRDDLISLFIVKMFESVVKSWEGYPCVEKLKANPPNKGSEKISTEFVPLSDAKVNDEKWEKNDSVTEQSTKQEILQKYLDVKMSSLVEQELRNRHFSVESMIPELTWITEANGDMNQPIDDWKRYKDDQIAKIEFRNGNVYKGRVSRHVMHGEGEFIWLDGTSYKGSFDTGHITGNGVVTWPTQSWYKGELVKGYRQGNGLLVVPGRLAFAGSWANGVRYGPGLLLQDSEPTRGYCDTTWRRDVCHGLGTRIYPSGAVFHGHWQDGKRHGFGVINWPNGDMYRGDWKNDRMHGLGEFTWSLGAATSHKSSISFQNRYYGTWVDGSRHGIGILETDSGMILKCKWKMDMKHGYGEIICNNGFLLKGDPLFANDHLLDPISNSRHASISTKTCLLNAHFIQKGKKLKKQNVQTHLSCESIDFCYHVDRYMQNKWNLKQFEFEKKLEDESKAVGKFVEFEVKTPKTQLYSGNDSMTNRTFEGCFEEKWLRNIILRNLPLLKKVYFDYATILCKYSTKSWSSKIAIIRLFFWQILRDCKIQLTEKSVAEFDILVKNNHFALLKDHRNPFERLSFFQFLHYLIEISWHLYGKYGERQLKTPGALASALEKFIVADLKQNIGNNSGSVFKDSRNLCFMREIFGLYQSLQSDLTARQLLNAILNWKNNSYLKNVQEMSHDIIKQFDGRDTYAKIKICANQSLENLKKVKSEPAKIMYLAYLDYVNPRIAMKCILQICPRVKTSDRFYNMDYKMTFLELYEILLLCAVECFEFKKKQERRKQAIEIKLSQKPKEERRTSLKKTRVSRDNSAKALKISKKP